MQNETFRNQRIDKQLSTENFVLILW